MFRRMFYILVVWIAALAAAAWADSITLINGDRITGTLTSLEDGTAVFVTPYGELRIAQDQIAAVATDGPVVVNGAAPEAAGRLETRDGQVFVVSPESGKAIDVLALGEIQTLARPDSVPEPEADITAAAAAEEAEAEAEARLWSGAVEAGLSWRSGQTNSLESHTTVSAVRKRERDTLTLTASGAYGEVESEINTRRAKGEGKWQFYPKEGFYYYLLGGLEHDGSRRLHLRANTAGGIGYEFIRNEDRKLSGDVGVEYAREYWNPYDILGKEKAKSAARAAAYAQATAFLRDLRATLDPFSSATRTAAIQLARDLHKLSEEPDRTVTNDVSLRLTGHYDQKVFEKSRISNDVVLVPNFDDLGAYRLTNDLAFTTPLREGLSLRINLKTEYDSDIASVGEGKLDNALLSTLRYEF